MTSYRVFTHECVRRVESIPPRRISPHLSRPNPHAARKGSVFRSALGHPLKRVSDDAYRQLFETTQETVRRTPPLEGASPFLANLNEIPTPYVLEPPLTAQRFFEPGAQLQIHLILVGDAIEYLPFFVLVTMMVDS